MRRYIFLHLELLRRSIGAARLLGLQHKSAKRDYGRTNTGADRGEDRLTRNRESFSHDFFAPTASILVPRSFKRTAAAFRPGYPVIDPPGGVHAPVWYRPAIGSL